MRQITARVPSGTASLQVSSQSMAPTLLWRIHAAAKSIPAWAKLVAMKAMNRPTGRAELFEFAFGSDIDQTWLLCVRRVSRWFRVSLIDGGGRLVKYEDGVFEKFDQALADADSDSAIDPTMLFIATDGRRVYKAFSGPESAVGQFDPYFSTGFDDGVYIGIWSHAWLQDMIVKMELDDDPDASWGRLMEDMVSAIADYADARK